MNPRNFFGELKRRNVYKVRADKAAEYFRRAPATFDPMLTSVHNDPRFAALVKKVGFAE